MPDPGDSDAGVLRELAADLAADVAKRYRIDASRAVEVILNEWSRNTKLLAAIEQVGTAKQARRARVYRDAATALKKTIYHKLRAYRPEPSVFDQALADLRALPVEADPARVVAAGLAVARAHISTAERLAHRDAFLDRIAEVTAGHRTVLDVGAGVLPALLGPAWLAGHGIDRIWAVDKDARAVEALSAYARLLPAGTIRPVRWNIADGWPALHAQGLPDRIAIAWLLKVIPVVARQEADLLSVLAATPAERLLLSGSRMAMAKRQDIEARERRVLRRFCEQSGFRVVDEFATEDEFFLLTERG